MNVFYEESGSFKVGSVVSRADASLQIDTQHGKRTKLKAANVFLEFSSALQDFLPAAEAIAARRAGKNADPLALYFPNSFDGLMGIRFVDSVVKSSNANGQWTKC